MDNYVSRKIKKKLKNLKTNKNSSDDRVYRFDESPLQVEQSPSLMQKLWKKKKEQKYHKPKADGVTMIAHQASNALSSTSTSYQFSNEIKIQDEIVEKVNRNSFFRNGWVTNLEENKRLVTERNITTGYGSTHREPKILKSIKLNEHRVVIENSKNSDLKSLIRDYPTSRSRKYPMNDVPFDDVMKIGYISP